MAECGCNPGKFRAVLVSITRVKSVTEELMAFVSFRANLEGREIDPEDEVAIFNVHTTASNFVVFLDEGKTMEDFEEEIIPYNVVISTLDWQQISNKLETRAQYAAATKD
jgi:hypothetical protein